MYRQNAAAAFGVEYQATKWAVGCDFLVQGYRRKPIAHRNLNKLDFRPRAKSIRYL
jgi:hypothetical protein